MTASQTSVMATLGRGREREEGGRRDKGAERGRGDKGIGGREHKERS